MAIPKDQEGQQARFTEAERLLSDRGLQIDKADRSRPWGGFFVIAEEHTPEFMDAFFPALSVSDFSGFEKLSPKLLIVAPGKRLSWQYHFRRSEIWRVLRGTVGVIVSENDEQGSLKTLNEGDSISLKQGERHRLVGLEDWAILAEIWQHTDPGNPSDENDIVRLEDDFGR